jgi:hypothetical protein
LVIMVAGGTPAFLVQFAYGNAFSRNPTPEAVPQSLAIPAELLQVVVQALFGSIAMTLASLFYVDMRVRREGLDIESQLRSMEAQATPKAEAAP